MKGMDKKPQANNPNYKLEEEKRALLIRGIQEKLRKGDALTFEEKKFADQMLEQERIDDQQERRGRY